MDGFVAVAFGSDSRSTGRPSARHISPARKRKEEPLETTDSNKLAWRADFAPALVVVLISIPLALGIAIASGIPPARGLVTAIIGGLVIGRLAGSPLQISGPSSGQAVMVFDAVSRLGLEALGVMVILVGLLQLSAGTLRLGQVFRAVSPAVINGMLAGIGVLLLSTQFHVMVDDAPQTSGLANLVSIPSAAYKGLVPTSHADAAHRWAALVGVLTLGVLLAVRAFRKGPMSKVPAPLVAVSAATLLVWLGDLPVQRVDMPESGLLALDFVGWSDTSFLTDPAIWGTALALAIVASAETLLCATAVDAMHDGPRTNYDRELVAQGVGNTLCGIVGAPPATGVITRSTVNVHAGAKSRASTMMVGAWTLLVLVAFPKALEVVPTASLAALLVYIGFKLVKDRPYAELRRYGKSELAIFIVTVFTIVAVNLLAGIVLGVVLAAVKLVISQREKFHRLEIDINHDEATDQTHVHLRGAASFLRLPRLASALESLPARGEVHLHVEQLEYIDHACLDLLDRWECERLKRRLPVRVQWQTLHHRYHAGNPLDRTPDEHAEPPSEESRLLDFLTPRRILIDPDFRDKWDAIEKLSRHLVEVERDLSRGAVVASVKDREHEASTCIGHGLMVPHGTLPPNHSMTGVMAVSSKGWNFGAEDGEPVRCVLLLATPDSQASRHLAVLAAFARLFMISTELRDRLLSAATPENVYALLQDDEAAFVNYAFEGRPEMAS